MVERKPRVAVTLSDEALELVQRLAQLNKGHRGAKYSAAGVVAELIEAQIPMLRQLVELGEASKNLTDEQRARLAALADNIEPRVTGDAATALGSWNDALEQFRGAISES